MSRVWFPFFSEIFIVKKKNMSIALHSPVIEIDGLPSFNISRKRQKSFRKLQLFSVIPPAFTTDRLETDKWLEETFEIHDASCETFDTFKTEKNCEKRNEVCADNCLTSFKCYDLWQRPRLSLDQTRTPPSKIFNKCTNSSAFSLNISTISPPPKIQHSNQSSE